MKATVVTATVQIGRPANEVWDAIADYSFDLQWRLGITEMTPDSAGPPQEGTRIHEVLRSSGMSFVTDANVFDVDPGVGYRFTGTGTTGLVRGLRRVEPETRDSSRFTYQVELQPRRHYRALRPLLKAALGSGLRKDLQRLKQIMESRPAGAVSGAVEQTCVEAVRQLETVSG
jgi:hypothetical protein